MKIVKGLVFFIFDDGNIWTLENKWASDLYKLEPKQAISALGHE